MRAARALFVVAAAIAGLASTGCTTGAFCFSNCGEDAGAADATVDTVDLDLLSGDQTCFFCGDGADAADACQVSNGGIEICDGIDNDCNGVVDDGIDFTKPDHCGTCDKNCNKLIQNATEATCT